MESMKKQKILKAKQPVLQLVAPDLNLENGLSGNVSKPTSCDKGSLQTLPPYPKHTHLGWFSEDGRPTEMCFVINVALDIFSTSYLS